MIRDEIKKELLSALKKQGVEAEDIELTRPVDAKNGDYSTNAALKFSHEVSQSPIEFANILADSLKDWAQIEKLEVKEPGFLNIFVKDVVWQKEVEKVLKQGSKYGANEAGKGKKARVEFVSANPTGPLHFGNARGGPIGDALASVLEFSGYHVVREYYHNDLGGQVEKLGESILNVASGKKLEDQEYKGEYVRELADKLGEEIKSKMNNKTSVTSVSLNFNELGRKAVAILNKEILSDCQAMGIHFDETYAESSFLESGQTKEDIDQLREKGFLKENEGALWFAPHLRSGQAQNDEFLNDRETVVVKSDGNFTYFANDIAYHDLKFKNADLVIDIFGANHHGHVPRLRAAVAALGYNPSDFKVILYQWVRFKRGGELVKMSKRAGTFVTAREVLDEVGRDALRFFILMYDANSHIDFDLDLAREKSSKNPVYYVQYANARIFSILANSKFEIRNSKLKVSQLSTGYELRLIKQITKLPELVEDISKSFAVNQLTTYARELADVFHKFYENCRVLGEKEELEEARLALVSAAKISLENTLTLLGVSAPEKM